MINGDTIKNKKDKVLYFYQCLKDHKSGTTKNIQVDNPKLSISNLETFDKSPSRLFCDAFWNSIDYKNLELQLKSKLTFFDIGCGSGEYGNLLKKFSGGSFGNYLGLDIYKSERFSAEYNHIKDKAENAYKFIDNEINFIISQSALEHIEYDLLSLKQITDKLIENNKPFIQIHMIPAEKCLWLYLCHGWRQYSQKNLATISDEIKKLYSVNISIVPLGGNRSFWTHLKYITVPLYFNQSVLRKKKWKWSEQKNLEKKIVNAVKSEIVCNNNSPLFWAFLISSNGIKINYKSSNN